MVLKAEDSIILHFFEFLKVVQARDLEKLCFPLNLVYNGSKTLVLLQDSNKMDSRRWNSGSRVEKWKKAKEMRYR